MTGVWVMPDREVRAAVDQRFAELKGEQRPDF